MSAALIVLLRVYCCECGRKHDRLRAVAIDWLSVNKGALSIPASWCQLPLAIGCRITIRLC